MPSLKASNKSRRNSGGIRKSVSPTRTAPVQRTASPFVSHDIVTCVYQRVKLPGWGVNGWKLFTTKHMLRVVEVESEAEAVAQLAAALESEMSFFSDDTAKTGIAVEQVERVEQLVERPVGRLLGRPLSLRIPGCRLNHRETVAMRMPPGLIRITFQAALAKALSLCEHFCVGKSTSIISINILLLVCLQLMVDSPLQRLLKQQTCSSWNLSSPMHSKES